MRLELSDAISFILVLPSQRSNNEGHRKLGDKALELLIEYKDLGNDNTEKAFNRAMIASVMSAVRAFSVERDRISGVWKSIEEVKERRIRLLEVIRSFSPMEKENYWSKIVLIIASLGLSINKTIDGWKELSFFSVKYLVLGILLLELSSKILEFIFANIFEKSMPIEKTKTWQKDSLTKYKNIISGFIDTSIDIYERYYPNDSSICGFDITTEEKISHMKENLLKTHFYLD